MSTIKRRQLLKYGLVTTGGLWVFRREGLARATVDRGIGVPRSTTTLPPDAIPKYTWPLLIPPVMPESKKHLGLCAPIDYYEIAVRQFEQQVLPPELGLPPTTVWGYGSINHPETFSSPSFTIEAKWQRPVRVKWINDLKDLSGHFLPHPFPVDTALHWANPPGGLLGRDKPCNVTGLCTPGPYKGPVPLVTHLHGVSGAGQESDGFAEAWVLPRAIDIPDGYAKTGTFYDYFRETSPLGRLWEPGASVYEYPNEQRAGTLWYHDHTLGITRLNVYAGAAGYYLIRGGPEDLPTGVLPGPPPRPGDWPDTRVYEVPLVIQDRTFNNDGSLFYPDRRELPHPAFMPHDHDHGEDAPPIWIPMFTGDAIVVNGRTWPYLEVEQRRYRFRLLNACNARALALKLSNGLPFWQIGADAGGFLPAPAQLETLVLAPAERADVIVDFTSVPIGTEILVLNTIGSHQHASSYLLPPADQETGEVMQLRVMPATCVDTSTPPERLCLPPFRPHGPADAIRLLSLTEAMAHNGDLKGLLQGNVDPQTLKPIPRAFHDLLTENPDLGATELWELHNFTMMVHPIHVHDVDVQVIDRQSFGGSPRPPEPGEMGFKDTIAATPGEITRIKVRFRNPGMFMWHCHILEHEDNDMMRPIHVGPLPEELPQQ